MLRWFQIKSQIVMDVKLGINQRYKPASNVKTRQRAEANSGYKYTEAIRNR